MTVLSLFVNILSFGITPWNSEQHSCTVGSTGTVTQRNSVYQFVSIYPTLPLRNSLGTQKVSDPN